MFKNYLTYSFAIGFQRACFSLETGQIEKSVKERLMRSCEQFVHAINSSIHATDPTEYSKFVCTALLNLRDCKETLVAAKVESFEIDGKYYILHGRLEQICL